MVYKIKNNKLSTLLSVLCCTSMLLLSGCASTGTPEAVKSSEANPVDPYEDFNRSMFSFNKVLDDYVADPIVDAYDWVTPHFLQTGIGNFFSNLKDVNVILNDVMQAKFLQSGADTGRLLLNTTLGLGGLFDVASELGLEKHEEDFDQTFAVWGIPQGPYLVLPVLGPTTGRGIPGGVLDVAANPASYIGKPIQMLAMLNERANADSSLKIVDEAALDPYVFTREGFLQRRKHLISDGKSDLVDDLLSTDDSAQQSSSSGSAAAASVVNTNEKDFKKASDGFSNTEKSLNKASQSLKTAAEKIKSNEK